MCIFLWYMSIFDVNCHYIRQICGSDVGYINFQNGARKWKIAESFFSYLFIIFAIWVSNNYGNTISKIYISGHVYYFEGNCQKTCQVYTGKREQLQRLRCSNSIDLYFNNSLVDKIKKSQIKLSLQTENSDRIKEMHWKENRLHNLFWKTHLWIISHCHKQLYFHKN